LPRNRSASRLARAGKSDDPVRRPAESPAESAAETGAMKDQIFTIADIYVPAARRKTIDPDKVAAIAESVLEEGLQSPILVRRDGDRLVLVEGLQRLEACRSLGEETIVGLLVQAKRR
jgi:hypothetical protein